MIDLYTAPTPNGWKASVMLEEIGMPYEVHPVDIMQGDQFKPEFLTISPNNKIPAIVDRDNDNFSVFESGAILIYLAEKSGQLLPTDVKGRSEVIQWLMFQMGGVGPMMGQANVFYRYFPEKIPAAIKRYHEEVKRLFTVLDTHLEKNEWLAQEYSIADIANWSWVRIYKWSGVPIDEFSHLQRWIDAIAARPAADRGVKVPFDIGSLLSDDESIEENGEEFAKNAQSILTGLDK